MLSFNMNLPYVYDKDDDKHPEAIRLETAGTFNKVDEKVETQSGKFQRLTEYSNGLIVLEEMTSGKHLFKFNKPFVEVSEGVLRF